MTFGKFALALGLGLFVATTIVPAEAQQRRLETPSVKVKGFQQGSFADGLKAAKAREEAAKKAAAAKAAADKAAAAKAAADKAAAAKKAADIKAASAKADANKAAMMKAINQKQAATRR